MNRTTTRWLTLRVALVVLTAAAAAWFAWSPPARAEELPVAVDDRAVTPNEKAVTIEPTANDRNLIEGATIAVKTGPKNGGVSIEQTVSGPNPPTLTYTPRAGFAGVDQLIYEATDGLGRSASAAIVITVVGATPLSASGKPGIAVTLDPFAALPGARESGLSITVNVPSPQVKSSALTNNGSADVNRDGTITYRPNDGFAGTDAFTYTMSVPGSPVTNAPATVDVTPVTPPSSTPPSTTTAAAPTTSAVIRTVTTTAVPTTTTVGATTGSPTAALLLDTGTTVASAPTTTTSTTGGQAASSPAAPPAGRTEVAAAAPTAAPAIGGGDSANPLRMVSPDGGAAGPPGVTVDVFGGGYGAGCGSVYIFFDGQRVGTASPDDGGAIHKRGLAVPGGVSPGRHQVTTSCDAGGQPVVQVTAFDVDTAGLHRTGFATALTQPRQVVTTVKGLATSALIAVFLLLLIAFPAELFNSTLEENYEEVRGWFAWLPLRTKPATGGFAIRRQASHMATLLLAGGLVYGLLDPSFGLNRSSLLLLLGTVAALALVTVTLEGTALVYRRRYEGGLRLLPGTVIVAAVCVLLSRAVHLQPGYCYGLIASAAFVSEFSDREDGRVIALASGVTLAVGSLAWVAWVPVSAAAGKPDAGFGALALDSILAAIFVAALGTCVFGLVPLRFMDGAKVKAWSGAGWVALFGMSVFALVHILLRPGTGFVSTSSGAPVLAVVAAFAAFGAVSVAFWAYFRFRQPRALSEQGVEGGAQVVEQVGSGLQAD